MNRLFAPWRQDYVEDADEADVDGSCPFCQLPSREDDHGTQIVARSERAYVILNEYPYNRGHVMVVPYEHTGEYATLDPATVVECARFKRRAISAIRETFDPDGFNVGTNIGGETSGASIGDHLHTHVVPRWDGDTNFIPATAESKVIVEELGETWERLRAAFARQDGASAAGRNDSVRISFE